MPQARIRSLDATQHKTVLSSKYCITIAETDPSVRPDSAVSMSHVGWDASRLTSQLNRIIFCILFIEVQKLLLYFDRLVELWRRSHHPTMPDYTTLSSGEKIIPCDHSLMVEKGVSGQGFYITKKYFLPPIIKKNWIRHCIKLRKVELSFRLNRCANELYKQVWCWRSACCINCKVVRISKATRS
jgi:hypothetical protein